jgi:2,5-furandicarboxylate decarboxylase 1
MEHRLLQLARAVTPNVTAVRMPLPLTVCVALNKKDDSEPKRIIDALASQDIYVKQVIIVDSDVDVSDIRQVATATALHVRADRDIYILPPSLSTELDPAADGNATISAKFGIDATVADLNVRRIAPNRVPKHVLDSINLSEFLSPR